MHEGRTSLLAIAVSLFLTLRLKGLESDHRLPTSDFSQAAATVSLLPEPLEFAVDDDAWRSSLSFVAIALYFSFLSSCFICCSLHSKLQKAVSPLYVFIIQVSPSIICNIVNKIIPQYSTSRYIKYIIIRIYLCIK